MLKQIFLLLLLDSFLKETVSENNLHFFNFRKATLENFNDARRLLAGGDIAKLCKLIPVIPKSLFNSDILGPAADMYQLKWSRQLEKVGYEYMKQDSSKRSSNPLGTIKYKDHIGFYWKGSVFSLLMDITNNLLPETLLKDKLKDFLEILEGIAVFLWLAISSPKTLPLKEGEHFGAAEALFGERYELGCFTELAYSVCFVKSLPYREHMFKVGVPCTSCPTHCEFWEEYDGTIVEGELCVPPKEEQVNYVAGNVTLTDGATTNSVIINCVLLLVLAAYDF
ncbi:unnamed protein product [Caenorhabditis nigoni]